MQFAYDRAKVGTRAAKWINPKKDELLIPDRESAFKWIASFDRQLKGQMPKHKRAEILIARAMVWEALGAPEMVEAASEAWNCTKTAVTAHLMAVGYHHVGNIPEACKYYERAYQYPHEAGFNIDLAYTQALLFQGRWTEAHEQTLKLKKRMVYAAYLPEWDGDSCEELSLISEGGFGDWIQMLRFVPELQSRTKKLTLYLPPMFFESGFVELLRAQDDWPEMKLLTEAPQKVPAVGIFDLPAVFNVQPDSIPAPLRIVFPRGLYEKYRKVRTEMFPLDRIPTIGFCGVASASETPLCPRGVYRSLTEHQCDKILRPTMGKIRWVNLQKDLGMDDLAGVIIRPEIRTWSDTAAIIENLDAVVTVDTAVAHLSASMGKPTYVLLSGAIDWKFGLHEQTCPWYPTMRLFKNNTFGFDRAVDDLLTFLQQEY